MLCIPLFLIGPHTLAQTAPKYSNEFLAIGVGARALAMSNAMTSAVDDVTAVYWNPAALTDIEHRYQFAFQHAAYFAGIANYDYIGAAMAIDTKSHLGISMIRLGIDDIPDTRLLFDADGRINYDNINFFSATDFALMVSYARGVSFISGDDFAKGGGLTFGVNFKIVRRRVGEFASAWGFGVDASAKYRYNQWDFGLMLRDITTTFNTWTIQKEELRQVFNQTNNEIPGNSIELTLPKMILGASRPIQLNDKLGLLTSVDLVMTFDGRRNVLLNPGLVSVEPQLGLELDYEKKYFFRAGVGNLQRVKEFTALPDINDQTYWTFQPNIGAGFAFDDIVIDYALTDIGNVAESPYSHVFSIKFSLESLPAIYAQNKRRIKKKGGGDEK